jgi:hypothetical protein
LHMDSRRRGWGCQAVPTTCCHTPTTQPLPHPQPPPPQPASPSPSPPPQQQAAQLGGPQAVPGSRWERASPCFPARSPWTPFPGP